MHLVLDNYIPLFLKENNFYPLSGYPATHFKNDFDLKNNKNDSFLINWGRNSDLGYNQSTIETGFFKNAIHLDNHGLYQHSSLNLYDARNIIENYNIPYRFTVDDLETKLPQVTKKINWDGVVLAAQHPNDRSIQMVGTVNNYYEFIKEACNYYKNKLLIKVHPTNSVEIEQEYKDIAAPHGSLVERTSLSVIDDCEFIVTYNSTFTIDCILRNKSVNQYAPGYFWNTGIVNYTKKNLSFKYNAPDNVYFSQFYNFLIWKYCFNMTENLESIHTIFKVFKNSNELFPLPENLSYGQTLLNQRQGNIDII